MNRFVFGAITCVLVAAPALAEPPANGAQPSFEEVKQRRLQRIDQMRACVAKATSFDQMKACKPERKKKPAV